MPSGFINIISIFLILFSMNINAQESQEILESYINENYSKSTVSRLSLPEKDLKWILRIYFEDTFISPQNQEIFEIVKKNFKLEKIKLPDIESHNFSFKTNKRKYRKPRFTLPFISNDGKFAVFYKEISCKRGLCGGGSLILMEKIEGKWFFKCVLTGWIG